jgi:uncharacterized cupredoxin-like copper-binding protein
MLSLGLFSIRGARITAHGNEEHPAHIHAGTCAQLGDVVAPLSNVSDAALVNGTPVAGAPRGPASAIPVEVSITTVPLALADIISGGHAINIHESAENIGTYIACGNIGGPLIGTSDLAIGLGELNHSGYSGVAWLHDNGDGTTTVYVFLTKPVGGEEHRPEEGTPVTGAPAGQTVTLVLRDFSITPSKTTVKAGEPVTFVAVNEGTLVHEVVVEPAGAVDEPLEMDGREAEIEDIHPGEAKSLTVTFSEPGQYQLACHLPGHFEQGMVTQIEVVP